MAFTSIPSSLIQVGKAIVAEIFSGLKDNQDDLNTRLSLVEGSANKIRIYNGTIGNATNASSITGFLFDEAPADFTLTDAKIGIFEKGSLTGTLEFDIQKSTSSDFTSSVSVFTTKPSIDFSTASSYDNSSNAVFDATNANVSQGDYLRVDITSLPSNGVISLFKLFIIGEAS